MDLGGFGWFLFAVGGVLLSVYFYQDNLLYMPHIGNEQPMDTPNNHRMQYEDIWMTTSDNITINAWLVKQTDYKKAPTLIYFHGNAGNIAVRLLHIKGLITKSKCNVFIVEYRGYGVSEGKPSELGLNLDAQAALDYLKTRDDLNQNQIFVYGASIGAAVAISLMNNKNNENKVCGLIIENAFTCISDMIDAAMPIFSYLKFMSRNKWDNRNNLKPINCPILFLSSGKDEIVPSYMMDELFNDMSHKNTSRTPVEMVRFEYANHNNMFTVDGYYETVKDFVTKVTSISVLE